MVRFQCEHCNNLLALPPRLVGRKILCPLCESKLTVPPADPNRKFGKPDLRRDIERYKLTDWDRHYAKAVLDRVPVKPAEMQKAIAAIVTNARKGGDKTLADELLERGLIAATVNEDIRNQLKGVAKEGKVIECPNCFANILATSRDCRFCGQHIGDTEQFRLCPNCKEEQRADTQSCAACGANMITGLVQGKDYCHRCGFALHGSPARCPKCHCRLREDPEGDRQAREAKKRQESLKKKAPMLAVCAAVALAFLGYGLYSGLRYLTLGADRIALEARVQSFAVALGDDDPSNLASFLPPSHVSKDLTLTRTTVLTGRAKGQIETLVSILPSEIVMDAQTSRARVNVQTRVKLKPQERLSDSSAAIQPLRGAQAYDVTWHWKLVDGKWIYDSPLPSE